MSCGGDGHPACQPWGGAGKGNVGVSVPCWWARWKKKKKKKSQPGDAEKLMRAWIKIAAQSVTWYYFHARGGGICCFLWMNAKVSSCRVSPLYQPPEISGCAHPFCQRVPWREALPISPWQPRALLQVFIWASGCLLPFARGNKYRKSVAVFCQSCLPQTPGLGVPCLQRAAVLQNTAVFPWTRAACLPPRAGWEGCSCREILRDTTDNGGGHRI